MPGSELQAHGVHGVAAEHLFRDSGRVETVIAVAPRRITRKLLAVFRELCSGNFWKLSL